MKVKLFCLYLQQASLEQNHGNSSNLQKSSASIPHPPVLQLYNLFHPSDPIACRIEPLLSARFSQVPPVNVARYQKYPMGDGACLSLIEFIQSNVGLFVDGASNNVAGKQTQVVILTTRSQKYRKRDMNSIVRRLLLNSMKT